MARKPRDTSVSGPTTRLVQEFTRRWGLQLGQGLPPEFKSHMSASLREGLLAMASLWEATVRGMQERNRRLLQTVEAASRSTRRMRRRRSPRRRRA